MADIPEQGYKRDNGADRIKNAITKGQLSGGIEVTSTADSNGNNVRFAAEHVQTQEPLAVHMARCVC